MRSGHEKTSAVSEYLAKREVHEQWEGSYRTEANERFYEQAFNFIIGEFDSAPGRVIDVGCGPGFHSMRLAKRGFSVLACDFSPPVLEMARENVHAAGLDDKISFATEDILTLSFDDGSQECALCWGVLMHIPDVARAVAELSRVVKSGGTLVVAENSAASLQSRANRLMKKLLRRPGPKRTAAGLEYWQERATGTLLTREADIGWLVAEFASHGMVLRKRVACQFTEAYTKVPSGFVERLIHGFNALWFRRVRWAGPAYGNLLFFVKRDLSMQS